MKHKKIYVATLPAVSHDFAKEIDRRFPVTQVKPGVSQDELMYNAGMRIVVDFILHSVSGTVISGDPADIKPAKPKSFLQRLLGNS